jgi:hypothetical protein
MRMMTDTKTGGPPMLIRPPAAAPTRFSFPLTRRFVSVSVPAELVGTYLLLDRHRCPIYVGRADRCLRQSLLDHPLRGRATHFITAVADDARGAYFLECFWWHRYRQDGIELLNLIHPIISALSLNCPFCIPIAFAA